MQKEFLDRNSFFLFSENKKTFRQRIGYFKNIRYVV